ncbi:MAG: tripartite tricarboxylate transporter substrate-binding protein [Casimicrobiaceae bacterium]
MRRSWTRAIALAFVLQGTAGVMTAGAADDAYPNRPIHLILPNAPGSSSDVIGRLLAQKLGDTLGQQIVVENHAGAGGIIGMDLAKQAQPDGYTLVVATSAGTSIAVNLHKKLTYDPLNDFAYLSTYAVIPNLLVVTPDFPATTLRELIEYCKTHGTFMASAGNGSQSHLAGILLEQMGHFPSQHVPYKGGGASVVAVMSGEAQWTITPASSVVGQARSGAVRALAQSLPQRTALLPGVPAVAETVPGYSYSGWNGLLLPKGTPAAIQATLRAALLKTLAMPEVKEAFNKQGAEIVTDTADDFRKLMAAEIESTAKLVVETNMKVD